MNNKQLQPRSVIQFSSGNLKGLLVQVVSADGKCLCRDMDGSQYLFDPKPEDTFVYIGMAALGPPLAGTMQPMPEPSVPPPLNPEELLAPLPPDVKAVPMSAPLPKKVTNLIRPPKPAPYTGPLSPWIYTVTNGSGDVAEVTMQVRPDKSSKSYNGTAIIQATKVIPAVKPYKVESKPKPL